MFIQRDPIGLLGGWNVFQYVSNPTLFIDPLGLSRRRTKKTGQTTSNNSEKNSCILPATREEVIKNTITVVKSYEPAIKALIPDAKVGIRGSTATNWSISRKSSWATSSDIDAYIATDNIEKGAMGRKLPTGVRSIENAINSQLKTLMPCNGPAQGKLFSFRTQRADFPEKSAPFEKIVQIF